MHSSDKRVLQQPLGDGLVLRTAVNAGDVERVAELSGIVHGPGVASLTRRLFSNHPSTSRQDLIFVEDELQGTVVSSLCLIPWTWHVDGVVIPAGEMGIVGTLAGYRRRGLVRAQVACFEQRLLERGCLLSHIQGIPFFYRQFGFEYVLPLEGGLRLETRCVPDVPGRHFSFREATPDDIPQLMRFYDRAAADLVIHAVRNESVWRYLLTHAQITEMTCQNLIVQGPDGQDVGYVRLPKHHFGEELTISEVSSLSFDSALAVLDRAKQLCARQGKPAIRLNLPAGCTLMRLARSLEAYDCGTYAWQIRIPDAVALLRALGSVFERRIAASPFAGLSRDVRLSLFRETIQMRFVGGELRHVAVADPADRETIEIPPRAFASLVLGHQSREELHAAYPDVQVMPSWRLLVDSLFPQVSAFLYPVY